MAVAVKSVGRLKKTVKHQLREPVSGPTLELWTAQIRRIVLKVVNLQVTGRPYLSNCEGSKSGQQLQVKVAGSRDCTTNVRSVADFINRERHLAGAGSPTSDISMQMGCVFVVLAALSVGVGSYDDAPQVTVVQGSLRGLHLTSRKGRQFVGFQGVPYAKPPLGEMRFKVSRLQISWPAALLSQRFNGVGRYCFKIYLHMLWLVDYWAYNDDSLSA
jgi:hypothetical protein